MEINRIQFIKGAICSILTPFLLRRCGGSSVPTSMKTTPEPIIPPTVTPEVCPRKLIRSQDESELGRSELYNVKIDTSEVLTVSFDNELAGTSGNQVFFSPNSLGVQLQGIVNGHTIPFQQSDLLITIPNKLTDYSGIVVPRVTLDESGNYLVQIEHMYIGILSRVVLEGMVFLLWKHDLKPTEAWQPHYDYIISRAKAKGISEDKAKCFSLNDVLSIMISSGFLEECIEAYLINSLIREDSYFLSVDLTNTDSVRNALCAYVDYREKQGNPLITDGSDELTLGNPEAFVGDALSMPETTKYAREMLEGNATPAISVQLSKDYLVTLYQSWFPGSEGPLIDTIMQAIALEYKES
jgi:hypothetical protein